MSPPAAPFRHLPAQVLFQAASSSIRTVPSYIHLQSSVPRSLPYLQSSMGESLHTHIRLRLLERVSLKMRILRRRSTRKKKNMRKRRRRRKKKRKRRKRRRSRNSNNLKGEQLMDVNRWLRQGVYHPLNRNLPHQMLRLPMELSQAKPDAMGCLT